MLRKATAKSLHDVGSYAFTPCRVTGALVFPRLSRQGAEGTGDFSSRITATRIAFGTR